MLREESNVEWQLDNVEGRGVGTVTVVGYVHWIAAVERAVVCIWYAQVR